MGRWVEGFDDEIWLLGRHGKFFILGNGGIEGLLLKIIVKTGLEFEQLYLLANYLDIFRIEIGRHNKHNCSTSRYRKLEPLLIAR